MEIEEMIQGNLIGSLSTRASNNIYSSMDSNANLKNLNCANSNNLNNASKNIFFYQDTNNNIQNIQKDNNPQSHALIPIQNTNPKKSSKQGKDLNIKKEKNEIKEKGVIKLEKGVQIFNDRNDMELINKYNKYGNSDINKMKKR